MEQVNSALCTQRYIMQRPKIGLQVKEIVRGKINAASDQFGALAACNEHRAEVLGFVNILR